MVVVLIAAAMVSWVPISAQQGSLPAVVKADLMPNQPRTYRLSANAGDLLSGSLEFADTAANAVVTLKLSNDNGTRLRDETASGPTIARIAWNIPTTGTYRLTITTSVGATIVLRTQVRSPGQRLSGVAAVTPTIAHKSPRISELHAAISSGDKQAVERFWKQVREQGAPLVESIVDSRDELLVTFLWKQTYDTRNVLVFRSTDRLEDYGKEFLSHLSGTDVWYKTVRLLRGSRFRYAMAPNYRSDAYALEHDPLNPRSSAFRGESMLETPDAPDESWWRRVPRAAGNVTPVRYESAGLKGRRDLWIYTPAGYQRDGGPYSLLILFDGPAYSRQPIPLELDSDWLAKIGAPRILDNLIEAKQIPPTVMCLVGFEPDGTRGGDYRNEAYPETIARELVPWLRARYSLSQNPKDAVIGGYSAGGVAGARIALHYPDVFGNVLMQSAGSGLNLVPLVLSLPKVPVRFYQDAGIYEDTQFGSPRRPDQRPLNNFAILAAIPQRWTRDVLEAKGYVVIYKETGGEHDDVHWRGTLPEGLMALLGISQNRAEPPIRDR